MEEICNRSSYKLIILAFMILVNANSAIEAEAYDDSEMHVYENLEDMQTAEL